MDQIRPLQIGLLATWYSTIPLVTRISNHGLSRVVPNQSTSRKSSELVARQLPRYPVWNTFLLTLMLLDKSSKSDVQAVSQVSHGAQLRESKVGCSKWTWFLTPMCWSRNSYAFGRISTQVESARGHGSRSAVEDHNSSIGRKGRAEEIHRVPGQNEETLSICQSHKINWHTALDYRTRFVCYKGCFFFIF